MEPARTSKPLSGTLPWTRSCFVCGEANPRGLQLRSRVNDGRVVLDYRMRETDRGWRHIVHGGITITLLDEVMTWAAILEQRGACVAAEITCRLRQPIAAGRQVRAEAFVTGRKSRMILTEAQLVGAEGEVLAAATGKYMPMPADQVELCADDFVNAPDAIPVKHIFGAHHLASCS